LTVTPPIRKGAWRLEI